MFKIWGVEFERSGVLGFCVCVCVYMCGFLVWALSVTGCLRGLKACGSRALGFDGYSGSLIRRLCYSRVPEVC